MPPYVTICNDMQPSAIICHHMAIATMKKTQKGISIGIRLIQTLKVVLLSVLIWYQYKRAKCNGK